MNDEVAQLKTAIDANDLGQVQALMTHDPSLHAAPLGYNNNGPLTWAAECRGIPASRERLAIARWMLESGSDVHQGGDGPLMRAALDDTRVPMMELLVDFGADVNAQWNGHYPIIFAPCETLAPMALRWLIAHGADSNVISNDHNNCVQMVIGTYCRNPIGKHECLKILHEAGTQFADTAPLAVHRGRIDLLENCWMRDPTILSRQFRLAEFFPPELGFGPMGGLHAAPLEGGTLLHLAVEYQEVKIAQWLLEHGADANARSAVDSEGFGGHTPLFHTTVTLPPTSDNLARLLLTHGADPNARATLRKQLRDTGNARSDAMFEFHNVTPIGFARQFQLPDFVNEAAIRAVAEQGGV